MILSFLGAKDIQKQVKSKQFSEINIYLLALFSSAVSMQDLESALHYSFRQEIAICRVLDKEKLAALKSFVHVLVKVSL